jgi:hypothetical protein
MDGAAVSPALAAAAALLARRAPSAGSSPDETPMPTRAARGPDLPAGSSGWILKTGPGSGRTGMAPGLEVPVEPAEGVPD